MQDGRASSNGLVAFAVVYLTFFLDNVLLTVLVPIIPDWVRGESLALWATHDGPLVKFLNHTVHKITDAEEDESSGRRCVGRQGGCAAADGSGCGLCRSAPRARARAARRHSAAGHRRSCILVVRAARRGSVGAVGAMVAGVGRAVHGAGAALAGVAGLAIAAALPHQHGRDAVAVLLGAVALGVLVGYPFGGSAYALWSPAAPFQIICAALLVTLGLQYVLFSDVDSYRIRSIHNNNNNNNQTQETGAESMWRVARRGATLQCAGAVLLTTSVMAALEPCLPLWMLKKFRPERWQTGAAFLPDSFGYLIATSSLGAVTKLLGAERVALIGQVSVGFASLAIPYATSVWGLAPPQLWLGGGLGAVDAALAPALLACRPRRVPQLAALLQAAASAAYALGPVVGGVLSWAVGFETALRALGVANLMYAAVLYTTLRAHPLSPQWGAATPGDDDSETEASELMPLR